MDLDGIGAAGSGGGGGGNGCNGKVSSGFRSAWPGRGGGRGQTGGCGGNDGAIGEARIYLLRSGTLPFARVLTCMAAVSEAMVG